MGKYASGKFAKRISDRSGMAFPYNEMVQEWNGSWVHISEFEPKQPQLEPLPIVTDPQSLQHARAQIANSRVFVGSDGTNVNEFQTLDMPVTNYYANGVAKGPSPKVKPFICHTAVALPCPPVAIPTQSITPPTNLPFVSASITILSSSDPSA